jgi:methylenetetrahydrofolate dehydrogenase (NADP+)/methenyltetrahydrofolate cyclohydrolase
MTEKISPEKDVDGLTSVNLGRLFYGQQVLIPCTPKGVMVLLRHYKVRMRGARAVIVNRSALVGKPLYHLLLSEDATVTNCHSKTAEIPSITKEADILISAAGRRPEFVVTEDMIKDGAVVVDVAMNRSGGKFIGDVDFEAVSKKASLITPVPGGVGPMTIAMLLENTLIAASNQEDLKRPPSSW